MTLIEDVKWLRYLVSMSIGDNGEREEAYMRLERLFLAIRQIENALRADD